MFERGSHQHPGVVIFCKRVFPVEHLGLARRIVDNAVLHEQRGEFSSLLERIRILVPALATVFKILQNLDRAQELRAIGIRNRLPFSVKIIGRIRRHKVNAERIVRGNIRKHVGARLVRLDQKIQAIDAHPQGRIGRTERHLARDRGGSRKADRIKSGEFLGAVDPGERKAILRDGQAEIPLGGPFHIEPSLLIGTEAGLDHRILNNIIIGHCIGCAECHSRIGSRSTVTQEGQHLRKRLGGIVLHRILGRSVYRNLHLAAVILHQRFMRSHVNRLRTKILRVIFAYKVEREGIVRRQSRKGKPARSIGLHQHIGSDNADPHRRGSFGDIDNARHHGSRRKVHRIGRSRLAHYCKFITGQFLGVGHAIVEHRQAVLALGRNFHLEVTLFVGIGIGHHQRVLFDRLFGPEVHPAECHRRVRRRLAIDKRDSVRGNATRTARYIIVTGTGHQPRHR